MTRSAQTMRLSAILQRVTASLGFLLLFWTPMNSNCVRLGPSSSLNTNASSINQTILLLRHVEQPETESNQYQFTAPDDIDIVGYLRSLCYLDFFKSLRRNGTIAMPQKIVVQFPKHSRRGIESVVPLAYSLRLPITTCCRKFDVPALVRMLDGMADEKAPILVVWWGRMMPRIAHSLGVPAKDTPKWPNHWNGSSVLWVIERQFSSTIADGDNEQAALGKGGRWTASLRTIPMEGCDPEAERERYCFRSVWLPGLPRPDAWKKNKRPSQIPLLDH